MHRVVFCFTFAAVLQAGVSAAAGMAADWSACACGSGAAMHGRATHLPGQAWHAARVEDVDDLAVDEVQ